MAIPRPVLVALVIVHILLVWGGIGLLGEGWIRTLLCGSSRTALLSAAFGIAWLVTTVSPVIGLISIKKSKLQPWYLGFVALTMFLIWFGDFLREIGLFYCDGP